MENKLKLNDLMSDLLQKYPDFMFDEDIAGQLIIHTGLKCIVKDNVEYLVKFESECDDSES